VKPLYTWNFLVAFLAQTAFTTTNSLLAHYARWIEFLGGDVVAVGSISSVSAFVGLVFRPVLAPWIDRLGPRVCWCVSGLLIIATLLLNLAVDDVGPLLYFLRATMAVGIAVVFASGLTYVAQITPVERRAEAIGVLGAGGFAGLLIGPALGDLFLAQEQRTQSDFFWYFVASAAGVAVSILLVLINRPAPPHLIHSTGWHPLDFLRSARRYWPGSIMGVTMAFGSCMTVPFVYLADFVDQMPGARVGPFFIVYAIVGLTIRLGLRSWPDQFGPKNVLLVGMTLFSVGMWTFLLVDTDHRYWILVAGAICGMAHGLTFHAMVTLVLKPFPPEHRGSASTLALMGIDTGMFLSAQVLGIIVHRFGYPALFHAVALATLTATALFAWRHRQTPPQRPSVTLDAQDETQSAWATTMEDPNLRIGSPAVPN
jgi:predicted MFS family arabinose efflux permease